MKDQQREILNQVAAGTITAEEGASRLDALDGPFRAGGAGIPKDTAPVATSAPDMPAGSATRQVKVISQIGTADIVGDPSVAYVVADGPHHVRQDGDTMVIEHEGFDDADNFSFGDASRRIVINGFDVQRRKLTVRMNPDLALFATVQAGNVRVDGVHGPISGEVQAGNFKISDFRSPINLTVQAGNVSASGRLDSGASRIRCEMGSVKISLEKGSSVRITARTTLGKVAIEGESGERALVGQSGKDVTIGAGAATLEVDCTMGNVKVTAE